MSIESAERQFTQKGSCALTQDPLASPVPALNRSEGGASNQRDDTPLLFLLSRLVGSFAPRRLAVLGQQS